MEQEMDRQRAEISQAFRKGLLRRVQVFAIRGIPRRPAYRRYCSPSLRANAAGNQARGGTYDGLEESSWRCAPTAGCPRVSVAPEA